MAKVELKTSVKTKDGIAHYSLLPAGPGLYHARLIRFEGRPDSAPPSRIVLVRNVRQWSGSVDNEALLNTLGSAIDKLRDEAPIFRGESDRKRPGGRNRSPEQ